MPSQRTSAAEEMRARESARLVADLRFAQLRAEKCELKEAKEDFHSIFERAKKSKDERSAMEALSGLLRLAGEALDFSAVKKWDYELELWMQSSPQLVPPMVWYCKGAIARLDGKILLAQRFFHRYLRAVRKEANAEEGLVRGWVMLAVLLQQRNRLERSRLLTSLLLKRFENKNYRGMNGILYLLMGTLHERQKDYRNALHWFQKSHGQFLTEHNWYYHLYVLFGYARIARLSQNYLQAYWYLDLVEKASLAPEFGILQREIKAEKTRLEEDAVDLLIDGRKGEVRTRESGLVSLRKQYVLIQILEALSKAYTASPNEDGHGLTKAEIIESVWKERYRPEVHDNKLYYNINRLRKLIEPNVRKPQYLLNWKKGYRLAPGLKVRVLGTQTHHEGEMHDRISKN
ncbi:MAG: winged helix-turn-helix domain-containing protein [Bdellovibrio sp.]|nr:winged helix-turn-helix domain-containing protein [Bdellovibrio sp.]